MEICELSSQKKTALLSRYAWCGSDGDASHVGRDADVDGDGGGDDDAIRLRVGTGTKG